MKLFDIKEDKIIFYPNKDEIIITIIALIVFILTIILFLNDSGANIWSMYIISFCFLCGSIFSYFSSKTQIIVDKSRKQVIRKKFGKYRVIALFEDIERINSNIYLYNVLSYYTLITRNDRFGDGIKLIAPQRIKSNKFKKMTLLMEELIPLFQRDTLLEVQNTINKQPLIFEQQEEEVFFYIKNKAFPLIFGSTLLVMSIAGLYYNFEKSLLQIGVLIFLSFFALYLLKNFRFEIKVNRQKRFIEQAMWRDIFKKRYYFDNIDYISVEKVYSGGNNNLGATRQYAGVNIYLKISSSEKKKSLASFYKSEEANRFVNDLEILLEKQSLIE